MARRLLSSLLLLSLLLVCNRPAHARSLRVVATVGDLGAIAREVMGTDGQVTVLARPTQDPHFVDARPSLMLDLNRADLLLAMGVSYEIGWLPVLLRGARNGSIQPGSPGYMDASSIVPLQDVPKGPVDRSMGDIHPGGNPHFTLDPRNGIIIARALARRLGTLAPENAARFAANAAAFEGRLTPRIAAWERLLGPWRGTPVITYHKSFTYIESWLGLVELGNVEPKPGIPPNAAHVARIAGVIGQRKVPILLQERWYPSNTAELIASKTGAQLVLITGMTPDGHSYADHIDEIVKALHAALVARAPAGTPR